MGSAAHPAELLKRGLDIGETKVSNYIVRGRKPSRQTWSTFLENHLKTMAPVDVFTVTTVFQALSVFLVLAHDWRRILHFAVTAHPTAEWTASNCGLRFRGTARRVFLLRNRDRILGADFT